MDRCCRGPCGTRYVNWGIAAIGHKADVNIALRKVRCSMRSFEIVWEFLVA
jgi:hypothetical protein